MKAPLPGASLSKPDLFASEFLSYMPLPRMPMSRDAQLLEYLSLLRYGTTDRYHVRAPLLNFTTIAKVVKLKASTCAYLLKQYRKPLS